MLVVLVCASIASARIAPREIWRCTWLIVLFFALGAIPVLSSLALRFIPMLLEEAEQLIKAQTSRGADLASGPVRERLQSLSMLFIPLMHGAFRRAADLATALEARGYEVEGRQTMLHETRFGTIDYVVLGGIVLVTVSSLLP